MPVLLAAAMLLPACSRETERPAAEPATAPEQTTTEAAYVGARNPDGPMSAEEIARQRRDDAWRRLQSFQARTPRAGAPATQPAAVNVNFRTAPTFDEKLEAVDWARLDAMPVTVPMEGDVAGPSVFRAQVLLDRANFGPGVVDGQWGKNTAIAVHFFQQENGITPTGNIDEATYRALAARSGNQPALTSYSVTAEDVNGPYVQIPDDVYEQAELDCLCYESLAEKLAEQFHTTEETLAMLNTGVKLESVTAGQTLRVPNVQQQEQLPSAPAKIVVSIAGNYLHALDQNGGIVMHAPTTVGSDYDPSPTETLKVVAKAFDPTFHYQPTLFYEVDDSEPEAMLKAGPNSPVGKVWMALSKEHYGIHGTSDPSSIGYASSHGCIRLTNWNATRLARSVENGTQVEFVDAR